MTLMAQAKTGDIVMVRCSGLACSQGFIMSPDGFAASYANFEPDKATPMAREYADFLIAQDPTRFSIEKPAESETTSAALPTKKVSKKK